MYKTKPAFVDRQSNCTDFVQILIVDVFLKNPISTGKLMFKCWVLEFLKEEEVDLS